MLDFGDVEWSDRQASRVSHNPVAATSAAIARNSCFLFIFFAFWSKLHIHFRYGNVREFPGVGFRFGTNAGNFGAKRHRAGMNRTHSRAD